jgi:hypothetical protein
MSKIRMYVAIGLALSALHGAAMGAKPVPSGGSEAAGSDAVTVIAEGQHSDVFEPFIAVVRDAETYGVLRGVQGELPALSGDVFEKNTVVAAFLGTRRTDGHGVTVTRATGEVVRISEAAPAGRTASPGAPTTPFKVVFLPNNEWAPLEIELDEVWHKAMRAYRVSEGEFASRGGIAGRTETFGLEGDVRLLRFGQLITFAFDLRRADPAMPRRLRSIATGFADGSGEFRVPQLEAGGLVGWPNGGLSVTGRLNGSDRLSLTFEPLPAEVADGFEGRGRLQAVPAS